MSEKLTSRPPSWESKLARRTAMGDARVASGGKPQHWGITIHVGYGSATGTAWPVGSITSEHRRCLSFRQVVGIGYGSTNVQGEPLARKAEIAHTGPTRSLDDKARTGSGR